MDFALDAFKTIPYSREKSPSDTSGFCLRCFENDSIYSKEKVRVVLADFASEALKKDTLSFNASVWRLDAFRKTVDFCGGLRICQGAGCLCSRP